VEGRVRFQAEKPGFAPAVATIRVA
jgi:hypothetical protein